MNPAIIHTFLEQYKIALACKKEADAAFDHLKKLAIFWQSRTQQLYDAARAVAVLTGQDFDQHTGEVRS